MIGAVLMAAVLAATAPDTAAQPRQPPKGRHIEVAFVLSEGAVMIDFAGPWEVFQDAMPPSANGTPEMPFDLYTVAASRAPLHTSGGSRPGMTVTPDFTFADAPTPDVVVVGAQPGGPGLTAWLKKVHAEQALILSVCTGAFRLAETGLLEGKSATTYHRALQRFANQYPGVAVRSSVRYVQSDALLVTAGGLSSGIDAALHVVELYFGRAVAQATADDMEYQGEGWKTNVGVGEQHEVPPTIPLAYRDRTTHWQGVFRPAYPQAQPQQMLVLNLAQTDRGYLATLDVPEAHVFGEPINNVRVSQGRINFTLDSDHGPLTFSGTLSAQAISGAVSGDGKSTPLNLSKVAP
jgi:putative intracellular protease/amidase